MFEAVPVPPPVIFVQEVRSNEPAMLLGFMAVGPEADMARLETRATNLKFRQVVLQTTRMNPR